MGAGSLGNAGFLELSSGVCDCLVGTEGLWMARDRQAGVALRLGMASAQAERGLWAWVGRRGG